MKLKTTIPALLFGLLMLSLTSGISQNSQKEKAKSAEIKAMLENKKFLFRAQSATPMGGNFVQLTSEYDVKISSDTLTTFLPYFGRAFVAPMNPSEGGIRLMSTSFDYSIENRKKGGWNISIKPHDSRDVRLLQFTVTETGNATLQVLSNNRQPITFNGFIEKNA